MKMHEENKNLLDSVAFDASQTSATDFIGDALAYAVHFMWDGGTGVGGDLIVEGGNDQNNHFVPVDSYTISGESSGSRLVNIERAGYAYMRVRFVYSAGSGGTLTAKLSSKRL